MNLDDFNVNLQHAPFMVSFFNTPTTSRMHAPPHVTPITTTNTPRSISIKCKCTNAFSLVIEATNNKNEQIIEVMDQIDLTS